MSGLFSWDNKKTIISLLSAELAKKVVKVKAYTVFWFYSLANLDMLKFTMAMQASQLLVYDCELRVIIVRPHFHLYDLVLHLSGVLLK